MSRQAITGYHSELDKIIRYGGSKNEQAIKDAFYKLLNKYLEPLDLILIRELEYKTLSGKSVYPDGTVKDSSRLDYGWWESKDQLDDLADEIEKKIAAGYPTENILFEDSKRLVLYQDNHVVASAEMLDVEKADYILNLFVSYQRPEIKEFRRAIDGFNANMPEIITNLRDLLRSQEQQNDEYLSKRDEFLEIAKSSINPEISVYDINEMLIQHILTEGIFNTIFDDSQYHRENNVALSIDRILRTFFVGDLRRNTLAGLNEYYSVIRRCAASIRSHHEKQKFLNSVYENFYKAYNPNEADSLGIVYTPSEIVDFMIKFTEKLLNDSFGKLLSDSGVKILDPCTGTGTFITSLIDYLPPHRLMDKYQNELLCNEVSILPYYIANLNIEHTFYQKMGEYSQYKKLCLVDTLEHCSFEFKQLIMGITAENTERIADQNIQDISVIIGNPPYYANQANENDNNKARSYPVLDKRIKDTYVRRSNAKKTKRYDMYSRFLRWATDRIDENGVVSFITNSNFLGSSEADGFRKSIELDFSEGYVIDLGGDVRSNPKLSGTKNNVFGIQAGVAISFFIKKKDHEGKFVLKYIARDEYEEARSKLSWLNDVNPELLEWQHIIPDVHGNWLNARSDEFDSWIPVVSDNTKYSKSVFDEESIAKHFGIGVSSNRDEWVADLSKENLESKMEYFVDAYRGCVSANDFTLPAIKWSETLKLKASRKVLEEYDSKLITQFLYRPFCEKYLYNSDLFVDRKGPQKEFYGKGMQGNKMIVMTKHSQVPFTALSTDLLFDAGLGSRGSHAFALYRRLEDGSVQSNITDTALNFFRSETGIQDLSKENIFQYVYAVLHDPVYKEKYFKELQIAFPRIPVQKCFHEYVNYGARLLDLHSNYLVQPPFPLKVVDLLEDKNVDRLRPLLKASPQNNSISLDNYLEISEIPEDAWMYKVANKTALHWVLDGYKRKKPRDPIIGSEFFPDLYRSQRVEIIDKVMRVCSVAVETVQISEAMRELSTL